MPQGARADDGDGDGGGDDGRARVVVGERDRADGGAGGEGVAGGDESGVREVERGGVQGAEEAVARHEAEGGVGEGDELSGGQGDWWWGWGWETVDDRKEDAYAVPLLLNGAQR